MDLDTTRGKEGHLKIIEAFERREAQVLVGTQMVAKGLDFPNVTLVGVVAADSTLYLPDYRSAERTFQLLTQVAGRAGRAGDKGSVVVQTYSPGHPSIRFAKMHDYKGYFMYELSQRQAALFPPFALFVRVLFQGLDEGILEKDGNTYAKGLEAAVLLALGACKDELLYVSAGPAPIKKRQGVYRYQALLKLRRTRHTPSAIQAAYAYADQNRPATFAALEINPGDLY
jgi:primosomal protein N' (replication factor Y)